MHEKGWRIRGMHQPFQASLGKSKAGINADLKKHIHALATGWRGAQAVGFCLRRRTAPRAMSPAPKVSMEPGSGTAIGVMKPSKLVVEFAAELMVTMIVSENSAPVALPVVTVLPIGVPAPVKLCVLTSVLVENATFAVSM